MKKNILYLLCVSLLTINCLAGPPKPPLGKRWVLNTDYSDEFNGTELDQEKWYDYHPTWKGRPPGLFMPSQVSVADGFLSIRGEKMEEDVIVNGNTYNIKCGAVISRKQTAFTGYYECKFKANKTTLSTTFWFSNRKNFVGPEGCDKYSQEWDIQECIGREGDFDGSWFAKGMHSNAHYWYTDCDGVNHDYRASEAKFEDEKLASEAFDIYGGWLRDENNATYYYNNGEGLDQTFYDEIDDKPFKNPMGMNLVVETYPFPWIELPTDEELAAPEKNVSYYDWVRAYILVDAFEPYIKEAEGLIVNGDFEKGDLSGWGGWGSPGPQISNEATHVSSGNYACHIVGAGAPEQVLNLKPNTNYILKCNAKSITGSITLGVKDNSSGSVIKTVEVTGSAYKEYELEFNSAAYSVKVYYYAQNNEEGYIDDVTVEELNPVDPEPETPLELYTEMLSMGDAIDTDWENKALTIPLEFKANEDRELHLKLTNSEGVLVAETSLSAYAGYANDIVTFKTDSVLSVDSYTLNADIRPINGMDEDIIHSESVTITNVSVKDPKADALKVHPSPTSSYLRVDGLRAGFRYNIYNMQGSIIDSNIYDGKSVMVGQLQAGMYIIEVDNKKARFIKN